MIPTRSAPLHRVFSLSRSAWCCLQRHLRNARSAPQYIRHVALFIRIALHVAVRYAFRLRPREYALFLRRAATLLWTFRHNRIVRIAQGYKLQLYLPAYPLPAFFEALENKLLRRPPAPTSVVFSMTRACSYACPHCYQKTEQGADLKESALLSLLEDVRATGTTFFNIEGGEPFLRYERLLAMLNRLNGAEVWVNTTGTGATGEKLHELQNRGLAGIMVSLHSPRATVHDAFTGVNGSFSLACEALRRAKSLGLGTAVNSVLAEEELAAGGLDELVALARTCGADYVQLIHPKPCGGWLERSIGMQSDATLLRFIEEQHRIWNRPEAGGYPSLSAQVFEERPAGVGCTAGGVDRFYLTATGEVQPCEFLQISFGNVTEELFANIFKRMREAYAVPRTDWLCCSQAPAIAAFMRKNSLSATPLPWAHTRRFLAEQGTPAGTATPLYVKLGIYRP